MNQPTSSTQSTEVPEEAVSALAIACWEREAGAVRYKPQPRWAHATEDQQARALEEARSLLGEQLPALHKQGAEEERERLKLDPRKLRALGLELPAVIFDDAIAP